MMTAMRMKRYEPIPNDALWYDGSNFSNSQLVALMYYLQEFPDGMAYEDVLWLLQREECLDDDKRRVVIKSAYKHLWGIDLVKHIRELQELLRFNYGN